ncbi:LysR family transcriptional regulator [uncultured Veillonella sp.]|uniref:LysR family transcriptional regulator n=1 Tax=uncultured Veillonella sp. TaxID=159268 RepID=UPI002638F459|nr:LysR family transcriptional regulator [uncultured Veillonella sp.]
MISFLNLKYFLVLTSELNFNNAAKKLHITQQSLSGHIKKIESDLGISLFEYGPPLKITPAGIILKSYAQDILEKQQNLEDAIWTLKNMMPASITIGTTYARGQYLLPPIITEFQKRYPLTKVTLFEGTTPEVNEALMQGKVELSIGYAIKNQPNIKTIPLYKDPIYLVIARKILEAHYPNKSYITNYQADPDFVFDIIKTCPFITLTDNTLIGQFNAKFLASHNLKPNVALTLRNVGTMMAMCHFGMGFMFCPETLINCSAYPFGDKHIVLPLPHQEPRQIAINYISSLHQNEAINAFIKITKEALSHGVPTIIY